MRDRSPELDSKAFTLEQAAAIAATGNALVVAGAGTGKTRTLVERCAQHVLYQGVSLDRILMVTFTDAAAAEMRKRIRERLEQAQQNDPGNLRISEQLALLESASICTLHSFCLQLIRQHFYELEIDPQVTVLTEPQARVLQEETLDALFAEAYAGTHPRATDICALIPMLDHRRDQKLRKLIQQLHEYTQTQPEPEGWFARELANLEQPRPESWEQWLIDAGRELCRSWLPLFPKKSFDCPQLVAAAEHLKNLQNCRRRNELAVTLECIRQIDESHWKHGHKKHRKALKRFFEDAEFLHSVAVTGEIDPLLQDWQWSAAHLRTLLELAQEFTRRFAQAKRDMGAVDFHDLEQFSLRLLWRAAKATPLALEWQNKFELVFVDEYQDINPAQDQILRALSRSGEQANRFLVGDVKQSIYGFRQAEPNIFLQYAREWKPGIGSTFLLSENFRSRERLLEFINQVFSELMPPEMGGTNYRTEGQLRFGNASERQHFARANDPTPRAELIVCLKDNQQAEEDDRTDSEREARIIALRLKGLHDKGELWDESQKSARKVEWRDMVILLRAASGKVEAYAKEFDKAGVPLLVSAGSLFEALEVQDLLNLLLLLDNPLQDRPLLAVLRSPLAGLSADELVQIRLAARKVRFWTALELWHESARSKEETPTFRKVDAFLERFRRWRRMARCSSLTQRLERVLEETNYLDWLLTQSRPEQRRANVQQLLSLTREFDNVHRQNLYQFLQFLENEQEAGADREPPPISAQNAVRLMTIHKSKGLEFPIVVLPDLGKRFNTADAAGEVILDAEFGLCAKVHAPETGQSYPSLPFWLAAKRLNERARAEELRLLYVGMTRAQEMLILSGTCSEGQARGWGQRVSDYHEPARLRRANTCLDWLGPWFSANAPSSDWIEKPEGTAESWRWRVVRSLQEPDKEDATNLSGNPDSLAAGELAELEARLKWKYGYLAATEQAAKSSVTALRRETAEELELAAPFSAPKFVTRGDEKELDGAAIGLAHHQFLQWLDLSRAKEIAGLKKESARLVQEKVLSQQQASVLNLPAIARFWQSELGKEILGQPEKIERELPFTVRLTRDTDSSIPLLSRIPEGEFIVVQGAIDLAVVMPKEIWIVDFKTDQIGSGEIKERVAEYSVQLRLYALALAEIYLKPVTGGWLHFLHCGETIDIFKHP